MRCAPSVIYPVGRSAFLARLLAALGLGSLLLLMLWGWHASAFGRGTWWAVAVAWVLWVVWALSVWRRIPREAILEWDALETSARGGETPGRWFWCISDPEDGVSLMHVRVMADWQGGMLLRLADSKGSSTWVWAERSSDAARWPDFRRAIVFSGNA